jgi:hypothetical protein
MRGQGPAWALKAADDDDNDRYLKIWPRPIRSTSFPIYFLLFTPYFDAA